MAQIYLDVTRLLHRVRKGLLPTGVDRVGLAYVRRYRAQARAVLSFRGRYVVLGPGGTRRLFDWMLGEAALPSIRVRATWGVEAIRSRKARLPKGLLLHTAHSGLEFETYYRKLQRDQIGVVAMIHDLIPLTHPEYCRPGVLELQSRRMQVALANVRGVIANSDDTARSIAAATPVLGVKLPPMATALLAPGTAVCYPGAAPLKEPYFVILSTIEPRKNHWLLLHVWRELVDRLGDAAPTLVVIGRRGWECENVVDMLERCEALRGKVIEESECSDERLHLYLQHARALLFPSFVEGYGMPLVEALQLGVPVIASDLAVFHEIAAAIPDYLDPLDGPGWMHRVLDYAKTDSGFREQQLQRLQGYQAPTWEQHFEVVDEFIARLSRD